MKLTVATVELTSAQIDQTQAGHQPIFDLLEHLPKNPITYLRGGDGLIGWGEALRLDSTLQSGRIADLARKWREVVNESEITDFVQLPGSGLVAFGAFTFSDASKTSSSLIVPQVILGSRDGRIWLTRVSNSTGSQREVPEFWKTPGVYPTNSAVNFRSGQTSPEKFKTMVSDGIRQIGTGTIQKVVLARDIEADISKEFDVREVLKKLSSQFPTCWIYSVDGMFGASPELLVRVSHSQVSARVLAGTAGRGTDPQVDEAISVALATSSKNISEHAFAVDSLVESLQSFCTKVDSDPKPFSLALPNVWHLASDVHGTLKENASVLDVAAILHPTAAVAGTPTEAAQDLIEDLENSDRGRYAGPVGWIGADGDGEWAIALRGAQIINSVSEESDKNILRAFAGCGIVAGSDQEAELAETELKFRAIREAF